MYNKHFGLYLLAKGLLNQYQFFNVAADARSNIQGVCIAAPNCNNNNGETDSLLLNEESLLDSSLCTSILKRGYLTQEQLAKAVLDYEKECSLVNQDAEGFEGLDYSVIVRVLLNFSAAKCGSCRNNLFYDYIAILLNSMVKILRDEPAIWDAYELKANPPVIDESQAWTTSQTITVEGKKMYTNLVGEEKTLIMLASRYSKENLLDINEFVLDCAIEFFNVNNGLFIANLSNKNISADMDLITSTRGNCCKTGDACVVPIGLVDGQLYLVLSL